MEEEEEANPNQAMVAEAKNDQNSVVEASFRKLEEEAKPSIPAKAVAEGPAIQSTEVEANHSFLMMVVVVVSKTPRKAVAEGYESLL